MNIMNMKVARARRAVDRALRQKHREEEARAVGRIRDHITRATPWPVTLTGPRRATRNFLKIVLGAWLLGIFVVLVFMTVDRMVNTAPAPAHSVEVPL